MAKFVKAAHAARWGKGACALLAAAALSLTLILTGCGSNAAGDDPAGQEAAGQASITVSVSVVADVEGFEAQGVTVDVVEGATVFDALMASGIDVTASDSDYGKFVEAIGSLAGDASHGWVYTIDGEEVMEACDARVLAAGDAVEWSYISW